ncbi:MAG: nucleotidyltransferase [Clostridia bacterium]|nr:nucleotidyltransferase [Clostridia bacterium]
MKIVGITAEYNPFHNGHKYHIKQSKKETDADICAVVMSGNFVQRGAPAVYDKWERASFAIKNGADIVFELPVVYSLSTAEKFAEGAIRLLDAINCNYISFGSESPIEEINSVYNLYKDNIDNTDFCSETPFHISRTDMDKSFDILKMPNNILAFEYIKALDKINSKAIPFAIKRTDNGYNSKEIAAFSSATAIRNAVLCGKSYKSTVPENTAKYMENNPIAREDMFIDLIKYAILTNRSQLGNIAEVREGIENKIYECVKNGNFNSYEELVKEIKSKRYTYTAVSRMLFQILLGITKNDVSASPCYLRVLAFNKKGRELLKHLKTHSALPVITKPAGYKNLDEKGINMISKDFLATDIYNLITNKKGKADLTTSPVIIS